MTIWPKSRAMSISTTQLRCRSTSVSSAARSCREDGHSRHRESHILRLGTVAFATNPFELFLDFGNQIKARSYAEQTFLVQLAGGSEGYLPTEKAEKGGHYSAFIASGLVGHVGGEQLVRETLKNINRLFAE